MSGAGCRGDDLWLVVKGGKRLIRWADEAGESGDESGHGLERDSNSPVSGMMYRCDNRRVRTEKRVLKRREVSIRLSMTVHQAGAGDGEGTRGRGRGSEVVWHP